MTDSRPPVVAIVGATAVGKTSLSLALAHRLGAQIVNADSMQLYQGMDIGTAKLRFDQREGIAHHLLDIWPITHLAAVADYQHLAREKIAELTAAGIPVVVVGGSGLYIRALFDDFVFPGTDPQVRAHWEQQLDAEGPAALHELLAQRDPVAAAAIEPANGRRIVRALEVIELTGQPFTAQLPILTGEGLASVIEATHIGLRLPRPLLDERIERRVEQMWQEGLLEEVTNLISLGLREARTASRALGYASALRQLEGDLTQTQAQAETAQLTRRFARRQESWFTRDPRIRWLDATRPTEELVAEVVGVVGTHPTAR